MYTVWSLWIGRLFFMKRGWWGEAEREKDPGDLFPDEPTDEAVQSPDALPEDTQKPVDQTLPEFKLVAETTVQGSETASFELEPGEYFLWFRVEKRATGTMTAQVK